MKRCRWPSLPFANLDLLAVAVVGAGDLSDAIEPLRSGAEGLEGGGEVLPGVPVLGVGLPSVDAAREAASLVENMRVRRSFTDAFSTGFAGCSVKPFRLGDLGGISTDLIDGAWEDLVEGGLASAVVDMFRYARRALGFLDGAVGEY